MLADLGGLVDLVEAPGWGLDDAIRGWHGPMLLHNLDLDVSLANTDYVSDEWAGRANATIGRAGSPWFSLHLGFSTERVLFNGHMLPRSRLLERDELLARIVASATAAVGRLDVPLLLENLDYCPEGAYEHVCDPGFVSEVLEATGCGLLLDIGHLAVSASWLGCEAETMLAALPLKRVGEVHVSSPRPIAGEGNTGRLDDVHEVMTEREVRLLHFVLERSTPGAVVLEYRRDPGELDRQLRLLRQILDRG